MAHYIISFPGPPTSTSGITGEVDDDLTDGNGVEWYCISAGQPGTWQSSASASIASSLLLASGTAVQAPIPARMAHVVFSVTSTGACTVAVAIGPTSGVANALYTASFATTITNAFNVPLPANWYIKVTVVNGTIVTGYSVG